MPHKDPEDRRIYSRKRYREVEKPSRIQNPEYWRAKVRKKNLKRVYKLTTEDFDNMVKAQDGVCAICHEMCVYHAYLSVDHDHKTGQIRGLLCSSCNGGLGLFRDNPERLEAAASYLLNNREIPSPSAEEMKRRG